MTMQLASEDAEDRLELDALVLASSQSVRLLPALVPENAASERARLLAALTRGESVEPRWVFRPPTPSAKSFAALERAHALASRLREDLLRDTYLARLEELELDLHILCALGDARGKQRAKALGRRRFGTGKTMIDGRALGAVAQAWLDALTAPNEEPRTIPAEGPGSLCEMIRHAARAVSLVLEVRVEPRLAAGAATGERTIFVADRAFGANEARRLVAHEVLGHAVAAENGRRWPLALFSAGTAESFVDQEGLALVLEERAGALDAERRRTLALRVIAADWVHDGASFSEIAQRLIERHGLSPASTLAITERACRGGGVARDVGYLAGYLKVRGAIDRGEVGLDALRSGRISVHVARALPRFVAMGIAPAPPLSIPDTDAVLEGLGAPQG